MKSSSHRSNSSRNSRWHNANAFSDYPTDDDELGGSSNTERSFSDRSQQDPLTYSQNRNKEETGLVQYTIDDLEQEDDDDEAQHVLEVIQDGKHDRGVGRHRVRCILWTTFTLVLIAAVITLSVVLVNQEKAASSSSSQENADVFVLPPIPEGLAAICRQGYLEHQSGNSNLYDQCQQSCEAAECCYLPPNIRGTCLKEGNELMCLEYQKACAELGESSSSNVQDDAVDLSKPPPDVVPMAPPELGEWCSPNNLITPAGLKQCDEVCQPYACCWGYVKMQMEPMGDDDITRNEEPEEPMDPSYYQDIMECRQQEACQSYGPCVYLRAQGMIDARIEQHVNDVCQVSLVQASNDNRDACRDACKLGLCCFETPPSGFNRNSPHYFTDFAGHQGEEGFCPGKPDGYCDQYSSCAVLRSVPAQGGDDDDGDDDDEVFEGDDDFLTDDPLGDDDTTTTGDDDYYYSYPAVPPSLPADIAVICNEGNVQQVDESFNECFDYCSQAKCCKSKDDGTLGSCYEEYTDLCVVYAGYCQSLEGDAIDDKYGDDGGEWTGLVPPSLPADIAVVCNQGAVTQNDASFNQCIDYCSPAKCCKPRNGRLGACFEEYQDLCEQYASNCDNLEGPLIDDAYGDDGGQWKGMVPPDLPYDIAEVCSAASVQEKDAAFNKCIDYCAPARCCKPDEDGSAGSCFDEYEDLCEQYAGFCASLEGNMIDDTYGDDNAGANDDEPGTGEDDYYYGDDPTPDNKDDVYYAIDDDADVNINLNNVLGVPTAQLLAVCEESRIDANAMADCEEVCRAAECCDIPEGMPRSCLRNNYDTCMAYHKECSVLQVGTAQNGAANVPVAAGNIGSVCSVNALRANGPKACRDVCRPASCCWSLDLAEGESCRDDELCAAYAPCLILRSSNIKGESIVKEVENNCANVGPTSPWQDLLNCRQLCMQHTCCWKGSRGDEPTNAAMPLKKGCFDNEVCNQYQECAMLLTVGPDNP